ncbi:uncharacterized protein LOC5506567 [Nematostella vectensis]|uniref:uncharacterized protein LOC5506567 n=1 Tax=Nematostella vectensis TaxID=45351 RepID=UPI00207712E0|nr:uncharacterized protein LOC5506567 [Nematostella vectensis]
MARIFATIKRLSRFSTTTFSNGIFQPRQQTRNFHAFFRESVPRNVQNSAITQRNWLNSAINEGGSDDPEIIKDHLVEQEQDTISSENGTTWTVSCYVEGPKLTGVLQVEFSRVNKDWVPVSIHLETVQKTGDVICNVSGPLPNGVTRFTRLSND